MLARYIRIFGDPGQKFTPSGHSLVLSVDISQIIVISGKVFEVVVSMSTMAIMKML